MHNLQIRSGPASACLPVATQFVQPRTVLVNAKNQLIGSCSRLGADVYCAHKSVGHFSSVLWLLTCPGLHIVARNTLPPDPHEATIIWAPGSGPGGDLAPAAECNLVHPSQPAKSLGRCCVCRAVASPAGVSNRHIAVATMHGCGCLPRGSRGLYYSVRGPAVVVTAMWPA